MELYEVMHGLETVEDLNIFPCPMTPELKTTQRNCLAVESEQRKGSISAPRNIVNVWNSLKDNVVIDDYGIQTGQFCPFH